MSRFRRVACSGSSCQVLELSVGLYEPLFFSFLSYEGSETVNSQLQGSHMSDFVISSTEMLLSL